MQNTFNLFLLIFLPAVFANTVPPVAAKVFPKFSTPIDFGATFRQKRLFGDHKTIRGFIAGILAATLIYLLLLNLFTLSNVFPWYLGTLIGFLALFGDAVKSFFKRQLDISSGKSWFPFDQIDWILGTYIAVLMVGITQWEIYLLMLVLGLCGQMATKYIGYKIGINESWI